MNIYFIESSPDLLNHGINKARFLKLTTDTMAPKAKALKGLNFCVCVIGITGKFRVDVVKLKKNK